MITLDEFHSRVSSLAARLDIERLRAQLAELEQQSRKEDLWENQEDAVRIMGEVSRLQTLLTQFDSLNEWLQLGAAAEDELGHLESELVALEQQALFSGEYDQSSAIVSIHAGTGGVDAQDWAEMLLRMFTRYVESGATEMPEKRTMSIDRSNWKMELLDLNRGEEAGIKHAVFEIKGTLAYGLLKAEAGVHRLVRLSPFNAKNLRQTSFALVEVIPEIERDDSLTIPETDLRIDVFRAGGHGGQGVNTTDSAVRITHIPTGIVVTVQNERSQHQNKATAMKILRSKLQRLQQVQSDQETAILKGEFKEGSWGNQIRSYVLQPYQMVKDHRTEYETSSVDDVLNGDIGQFIQAYFLSANQ